MKKLTILFLAGILSVGLFSAWMAPDEGMWMLTQLGKLPWDKMASHGMKLSPSQVFDTSANCLARAVVLLGGGTGSFVSSDGLIITNHHVAFAGIQSVSSVQEDYLKNGFNALKKEDELSLPLYNAEIVTAMDDVTKEVLSAVSDTMSPQVRTDAIRKKIREIENAHRRGPDADTTYRVSEMFNGLQYYLFRYTILRDIRLVYAPPGSIGNYGGEVDNWMWPRHTGDFSFLRAYVAPSGKHTAYARENVPYHPSVFLPMSTKPIEENSFAMILGFPGRTFRYRTYAEIQLAKDETLPLQMKLFKQRMDIIENATKNDRAAEIKYSNTMKGIANTEKNIDGTLEGMRRSDILQERKLREESFGEFLKADPARQQRYGNIIPQITELYGKYKTFDQKQIMLASLLSASTVVRIANDVNDLSLSFKKDSEGKEQPDSARMAGVKRTISLTYKNFEASIDRQFLEILLEDAMNLPATQRIEAVQDLFGDKTGAERTTKIREFVGDLYQHTKLINQDEAMKLIGNSPEDMRDDDAVKFAANLQKENQTTVAQFNDFNSKISALRGKLMEAYMAWKGQDIYPDANRTLRFTYGIAEPYHPRDAVSYDYLTTLTGVIEKETDEDPFIVPQKLHDLWAKKDFGPYADPVKHDVPVAFLADLDITGGNSGSPVMNGNGELIGVAFDGNWEAVVGDYLFQEPLNRTISVDSRYVLFILDKFSNAKQILNELVIK